MDELVKKSVLFVIKTLCEESDDLGYGGWVPVAQIGQAFRERGLDNKELGYVKLIDLLKDLGEAVRIEDRNTVETNPPSYYITCQANENPVVSSTTKQAETPAIVKANVVATDVPASPFKTEGDLTGQRHVMDDAERNNVIAVIATLCRESEALGYDGWLSVAQVGQAFKRKGLDIKQLGYAKLIDLIRDLGEAVRIEDRNTVETNPPSYYVYAESGKLPDPVPQKQGKGDPAKLQPAVMVRAEAEDTVKADAEKRRKAEPENAFTADERAGRADYERDFAWDPDKDSKKFSDVVPLWKWAFVYDEKYQQLKDLALQEGWDFGTSESNNLFILKNYLDYTFRRLRDEGKILYAKDPNTEHEFAAFNTGLVDCKYEDIYALFEKNTRNYPEWFLMDFVVSGEDKGKLLVALFNPKPQRANYFEGKIENMFFDASTGSLECDYTHIIVERIERFPMDFLVDNCPQDILCIDGVTLDDVFNLSMKDPRRKGYFEALGRAVKSNARCLNRLKNRVDDAVKMAVKRSIWDYRTAVPVYYPQRKTCSLLLPLCLVDDKRVDLALVVTRTASGAYQGQTVLTLDMAYANSRLVTRPDSDWLRADAIQRTDADEED